jgi:hypothetical protein
VREGQVELRNKMKSDRGGRGVRTEGGSSLWDWALVWGLPGYGYGGHERGRGRRDMAVEGQARESRGEGANAWKTRDKVDIAFR